MYHANVWDWRGHLVEVDYFPNGGEYTAPKGRQMTIPDPGVLVHTMEEPGFGWAMDTKEFLSEAKPISPDADEQAAEMANATDGVELVDDRVAHTLG